MTRERTSASCSTACGISLPAGDAARSAREALALYERKGNRPAAAATHVFIDQLLLAQ